VKAKKGIREKSNTGKYFLIIVSDIKRYAKLDNAISLPNVSDVLLGKYIVFLIYEH